MSISTEDRLHLMQLLAVQSQALDRGDVATWVDTFAADGALQDMGDTPVLGHRALTILAQSRGLPSLTRHWSGSFIFSEVDGGIRIAAETAVLKGNKVQETGQCINDARLVDGAWKIIRQQRRRGNE
jgi:hypothetical protein